MTLTSWLRPFQPEAKCPKCTTSQITSGYHPSTILGICEEYRREAELLADDPGDVPGVMTEHLCRHCNCCHYTWSEYTAENDR